MSLERWVLDMGALMNVREDIQPEPRQISMEEQQPLMAALLDAQQALYRAEDQYMRQPRGFGARAANRAEAVTGGGGMRLVWQLYEGHAELEAHHENGAIELLGGVEAERDGWTVWAFLGEGKTIDIALRLSLVEALQAVEAVVSEQKERP